MADCYFLELPIPMKVIEQDSLSQSVISRILMPGHKDTLTLTDTHSRTHEETLTKTHTPHQKGSPNSVFYMNCKSEHGGFKKMQNYKIWRCP